VIVENCIGGSIAELLKQQNSYPEAVLQAYGRDLVRALHYIHSQGIVLRNLNPQHILINEYNSLKVFNFSFAVNIVDAE